MNLQCGYHSLIIHFMWVCLKFFQSLVLKFKRIQLKNVRSARLIGGISLFFQMNYRNVSSQYLFILSAAIETIYPNSYSIPKKKNKPEIKPLKLKVEIKTEPVLEPPSALPSKYIVSKIKWLLGIKDHPIFRYTKNIHHIHYTSLLILRLYHFLGP